jgi:hypothetical protein
MRWKSTTYDRRQQFFDHFLVFKAWKGKWASDSLQQNIFLSILTHFALLFILSLSVCVIFLFCSVSFCWSARDEVRWMDGWNGWMEERSEIEISKLYALWPKKGFFAFCIFVYDLLAEIMLIFPLSLSFSLCAILTRSSLLDGIQ